MDALLNDGALEFREDTEHWKSAFPADVLNLPVSISLPKLNPIEPPWYGPVCPVVWEGRHREVSPYSDQWSLCG
jgi:hypothetical protein